MSGEELDISGLMTWAEDLPRPKWDLIVPWVESHHQRDALHDAWIGVERRWLAGLAAAFGTGYEIVESDHFMALVPEAFELGPYLLSVAERCRTLLSEILGDVAGFDVHGKVVLMALRDRDDYYRYISYFYPEGKHGGSAGINIRQGFAHVAFYCQVQWTANRPFHFISKSVVAHELTHVSLSRLSMPQWLEEGLAQMFEYEMSEQPLLLVDAEMAGRHKRYWGKHRLDAFWRGDGFSRPGAVQKLCYELAEILVRFLYEESRPRWFGWVRGPRERFFAFLRDAKAADCGGAASRERLGFDLGDLAGRFLGPGTWTPPVSALNPPATFLPGCAPAHHRLPPPRPH